MDLIWKRAAHVVLVSTRPVQVACRFEASFAYAKQCNCCKDGQPIAAYVLAVRSCLLGLVLGLVQACQTKLQGELCVGPHLLRCWQAGEAFVSWLLPARQSPAWALQEQWKFHLRNCMYSTMMEMTCVSGQAAYRCRT